MKKILLGVVLSSVLFASCGAKKAEAIRVGVCAGPYGDMFVEAIQPSLEKQGYKVQITEFSDYVQPNIALAENEIDVNMFQHSTYLKKFSKDHSLDLVYLTEIPTAAMGIFAEKASSIKDLPNNAVIAIPNDDTNLSRALRVLAQTGEIAINSDIDASKATAKDVGYNPKNFTFKEVNAEILPSVLDSVDAAIINGNYAIPAGLSAKKDGLFVEGSSSPYVNVIAVKAGNENKEEIQALIEAVKSEKVRNYISERYPNGEVVVVF